MIIYVFNFTHAFSYRIAEILSEARKFLLSFVTQEFTGFRKFRDIEVVHIILQYLLLVLQFQMM